MEEGLQDRAGVWQRLIKRGQRSANFLAVLVILETTRDEASCVCGRSKFIDDNVVVDALCNYACGFHNCRSVRVSLGELCAHRFLAFSGFSGGAYARSVAAKYGDRSIACFLSTDLIQRGSLTIHAT